MRFLTLIVVMLIVSPSFGQKPRSTSTWATGPVEGPKWELKPEEVKRLVVEWAKPEMEPGSSKFVLAGRLLLKSEDGKQTTPVNWVQPIAVIIVKQHTDRPDWSQGFEKNQCAVEGVTTTMDGMFRASFNAASIHRPIGATKDFQVGISLGVRISMGEQKEEMAQWTNQAPTLKQSLAMMPIKGPEPLSKTLQLITGTPSPIGWDYNPVAVIRAVNHLRSLGKEKAIAAMREFLTIARDPGYSGQRPPDPENIDTSNQWCLALLVPLVFESNDAKYPIPGSIERVMMEGDIPFHSVRIDGTSGWPPKTEPLVDWADKHGKIISSQLKPANNLFDAAETAYQKLLKADPREAANSRGDTLQGHLRSQVWRALRGVIAPSDNERYGVLDSQFSDKKWNMLKKKAAELNIHWDLVKQEYVAVEK